MEYRQPQGWTGFAQRTNLPQHPGQEKSFPNVSGSKPDIEGSNGGGLQNQVRDFNGLAEDVGIRTPPHRH